MLNNGLQGHIFVSGPPRSGTTLLRLVLSSHPAVTITPECSFFYPLMTSPHLWGRTLQKKEIADIIGYIRKDEKLNNWYNFDIEQIIKKIECTRSLTVQKLLDLVFYEYAIAIDSGTTYLGNKKGIYAAGGGPYIKALFPDSLFIFIIRDPRDVVRSTKKAWGRTYKDAAVLFNAHLHHIDVMCRKFPNNCLVIKYEDIITEPKKTSMDICDFLKVEFDDKMLQFYKGNEKGQRLVQTKLAKHTNTFSTFNRDLIGQWRIKKDLTSEEIHGIENICRAHMLKYGYEFSMPVCRLNCIKYKYRSYPLFIRRTMLANMKRRIIYSLNYIRKAQALLTAKEIN